MRYAHFLLSQKKLIKHYFVALDQLQKAFFNCYSEAGEDSLQIACVRNDFFNLVQKIRKHWPHPDFSAMEHLYETIFLMGQLRFRVFDRALFEVCRQEFAMLSQAISSVLLNFKQSDESLRFETFDRMVSELQDLYDGVLCITARDPAVFQFFFVHIKAFRREMTALLRGGHLDFLD